MLALALTFILAADPSVDVSARAAFISGQELYRAGRFAEAIAQFEKAYSLKPHAAIFFNIARCQEELGHTALALKAYRRYLHDRPDADDLEQVQTAIAALEGQLVGVQQLMVLAEPTDAIVVVDGKDLGHPPAFIELAPGDHRVRIERDGSAPIARTFTMSTRKSFELSYLLQPQNGAVASVSTAPSPSAQRYIWVPIAVTAVGVATLGVGFGLAAQASTDLHTELATQHVVTPRASQLAQRGQIEQDLGWVGVGLAAAGAIATGVVLFAGHSSPVAPLAMVTPTGATFGFSAVLP